MLPSQEKQPVRSQTWKEWSSGSSQSTQTRRNKATQRSNYKGPPLSWHLRERWRCEVAIGPHGRAAEVAHGGDPRHCAYRSLSLTVTTCTLPEDGQDMAYASSCTFHHELRLRLKRIPFCSRKLLWTRRPTESAQTRPGLRRSTCPPCTWRPRLSCTLRDARRPRRTQCPSTKFTLCITSSFAWLAVILQSIS